MSDNPEVVVFDKFSWRQYPDVIDQLETYLKQGGDSLKFFVILQLDTLVELYFFDILKVIISKKKISDAILKGLLKESKLTPDLLLSLNRETISFADLVIKGIKLSSLDSIISLFDEITEKTFSKYLKENTSDYDSVCSSISKMFVLRNKLSHSLMELSEIGLLDTTNMFEHVKKFLSTCDSFFIDSFNINRGQTMCDINTDCYSIVQEKKQKLDKFFQMLIENDDIVFDGYKIGGESGFKVVRDHVDNFIDSMSSLISSRYEGGSIQPLIDGEARILLTDDCIGLLKHLFHEHYGCFTKEF